ncbi:MAG: hypothetical protein R3213_06360, partial [Flavobacteriaceae bacterium]|nr:hypothetical protein [Flavobacteriaceae bacterium]
MRKLLRYLFIVVSTIIVLILIWASIDKLYKLQSLQHNPQLFATDSIDFFYRDHILLAYIHILPGLLFLVLGGYQLIPFFRRKNYKLHRIIGKIFLT